MDNDVAMEAVALSDPDAEALMAMLDAEVRDLYDGMTGTGALSPEERAAFNGVFLLVRRRGAPVACGAVRLLDDATGELKRIYVKAEERGSGVAQSLVAALERAAEERGLSRIVLETGDRMSRAIRFYESLGYVRVPPYAEHAVKAWAVCFEKRLPASPERKGTDDA